MSRKFNSHKLNKLNIFSQKANEAYNNISVHSAELTPTNYFDEYQKFFASDSYNPQYVYKSNSIPPFKNHIDSLWHELLEMRVPLELEIYIESVLYHYSKLYEAKEHIGHDNFADYALKAYPFADKNNQINHSFPKPVFADTSDSPVLHARQIQKYARDYISSHKYLGDVEVTIDKFNKYTIRAGIGQLIIGSGVTRNKKNVDRIMVHEIESHLLQKQNVYSGPSALLLRTQFDRELYAEGMAIYNEVKTETITKSAYDLYFHRLEAVSMIDKSFREIYEALIPHMSINKAYMTTFRVKRGMNDTGKPGGWPKDAAYLLGYKAVTDYLSAGGRIKLLYMTQVPELGELLIKHNALPIQKIHLPEFLSS